MPAKPSKNKNKRPITGANISWESAEPKKKEEKFSKQNLYYSLIGLFVLFLFILYAFVDDRQVITPKAGKSQKKANDNLKKEFSFQHSLLLNSTELETAVKSINDDELNDRLIVVVFDDSKREAGGQPTKIPLFKKFEGIAKTMPKKNFFKRYNDEDLPMIILFDCSNTNDAHAEGLCQKVVGENRPNVIIFRKGQTQPRALPSEHKSDHQIMSYLYNLMQPAVKYLEELDDAKKFVADDSEMNVVLFGDDKSGNFEKIADALRDFGRFGRAKNPSIAESFETTMPSLIVWRTHDVAPLTFSGNISDGQTIHHFIMNQYLPLFGKFTPQTSRRYLKRGLPIVWIAYRENDEFIKDIFTVVETAAPRYIGQLSFVKLDAKAHPQIAKNFGIEEKEKDEDKDRDVDEENEDDKNKLPQVFIMNQYAEIREIIKKDNIAESIQKVVDEYFHKIRLARGDIMPEIDEAQTTDLSTDEFEEDDDETDTDDDDDEEEDDDQKQEA